MSEPTFFKVATRPKWVGALLLALSVAAIFASLAQWQADRTYRYVPKAPVAQADVPLGELAKSSALFEPAQVDRFVELQATPYPGLAYVVANRIQLDGQGGSKTGYWLIRPATTDQGKLVTLALGWFATLDEAKSHADAYKTLGEDMMLRTFKGIYEPSEDPRPAKGNVFESLSIAQVINQPGLPDDVDAYAGFVILQEPIIEGEKIIIGNNPGSTIFNWLTAFYAVEWTLFAGFAVFLWGRLVKDAVIREKSEGRIK
jgi:cytochrome oxidase assembly protein ShyY1